MTAYSESPKNEKKRKRRKADEALLELLYESEKVIFSYYDRENMETREWKIHTLAKVFGCENEQIAAFLRKNGRETPTGYSNVDYVKKS